MLRIDEFIKKDAQLERLVPGEVVVRVVAVEEMGPNVSWMAYDKFCERPIC